MDFQVSVPGPFTYLVHEHARSILAIQELQREVTSLLEFRDNVLHALPHLHVRAYHSLTSTHDPPSAAQISQPSPITRGETSPGKSGHVSHHVTSAEGGRQQRPITTAGGVTATTNSGNSSSSSSTGGKSLSEAHSSAVADSGFSTDKAGGSMGKSSSSSAGEHLSGAEDHRWTSVEPELPLGSAEDELWQLLDVIQRKGTRLRNELERAERAERDRVSQPPPNASSVSDPLTSPRPHSTYQDFWPHSLPGPVGSSYPSRGDMLPPPPPPPPHMGMGMEAEAWAAVERLRQDRQYLVGRVNWAEAEAAASHQRLLDLHGQLLALAGDKRRLEDQVRALRLDPRLEPRLDPRGDSRVDMRNDLNLQFVKTNGVRRDGPASTGGIVHSVMGGVNTVHIVSDNTTATTNTSSTKSRRVPPAVTVSVASGEGDDSHGAGGGARGRVIRSASSVRINGERDVVLPRVLKVPIRDRTPRYSKQEGDNSKDVNSVSGSVRKETSQVNSRDVDSNNKDTSSSSGKDSNLAATVDAKGSDRVVIERERRAGKADGGLSMPVSLLKGGRIKVQPNKQRISAILREKDMVELQRQLLTTVMETEVLKKQIETAGEEWINKTSEWEAEHRFAHATITALRQENLCLKKSLEERDKVDRRDASTTVQPTCVNVATMTEGGSLDVAEAASHTVHPGPNIKYDVVVHEEQPRQNETNSNATGSIAGDGAGRRAPPVVEKPPRRCRDSRPSNNIGTWNSNLSSHTGEKLGRKESSGSEVSGKDSLGRGATLRHRSTLAQTGRSTPTVTPRSSPAPSIGARVGANRNSAQDGNRATPLGRSGSNTMLGSRLGRRDSLKTNQGSSSVSGKTNGSSGGQHKDSAIFYGDQSIINKSSSVIASVKASQLQSSPKSSLDSSTSPLALSDLRSPSPSAPSVTSQKKLFIKMEEEGNQISKRDITKGFHKRLSASDIYNCELSDVNTHEKGNYGKINKRKITLATPSNEISFPERDGSVASELKLSTLKSASESSLSSSLASTGSYFDSINTDTNMDDERLMHVEVAFEWNPIPNEEIRYLPPAAHMWNPDHTLTPDKRLPPVRSPLCNGSTPAWIPTAKHPPLFGQTTLNSDKVHDNSNGASHSPGQSKFFYPADSLEDDHQHRLEAMGKMRNKLRGMNGAVRVKNVDRPSVLSMVQGASVGSNKSLSTSKESLYSVRSHNSSSPKTSSFDQDCIPYETNMTDSLDNRPVGSQPQMRCKPAASVQFENAPATSTDRDLDSRVRQILARIAASAQ